MVSKWWHFWVNYPFKTVSIRLNVSPKLLDLGLQVKFLHKLQYIQFSPLQQYMFEQRFCFYFNREKIKSVF